MIKICANCKILFTPVDKRRKFCSRQCFHQSTIIRESKEERNKRYSPYHKKYRIEHKESIKQQKRIYNSNRKYGDFAEAHILLLTLNEEINHVKN